MIRLCVSNQNQSHDVGGNSLPEIESPAEEGGVGVNAMTVNQGMVMRGERKIEETRVVLSPYTDLFFKNQAV